MFHTNKDQEPNFLVMFGDHRALQTHQTSSKENTILITPSSDSWNDFGYQSRVQVHINLKGEESSLTINAFLGFITNSNKEPNGVEQLRSLLRDMNDFTLPATDSHKFFTMLPNMESYRKLVDRYGAKNAMKILKSIKDLVAVRESKSKNNWLNLAINTEIFSKSFIRDSDSFFSYNNSGPILRGLDQEKFYGPSSSIAIEYSLSPRRKYDLTFHFDQKSILPKRIAVIIGKNGVGKSQSLRQIAQAILKGSDAIRDGSTGQRLLVNRLLAFAPTSEASSVFPHGQSKYNRIWYQRFSLNRSASTRHKNGISDYIIQLARSTEQIGTRSRWKLFYQSLSAIDHHEQICLNTKDNIQQPVLLSEFNVGGEERLLELFSKVDLRQDPIRLVDGKKFKLSSGEISFVRFAAQASLHIENGSLLLLDEPETHLHPNFISRFILLLDNLLELTGSSAIIATHSAYIVREVFQDQVTVIRYNSNEDETLIETPRLKTFGADIGAISYFVFGEDEPSRLATKVETLLLSNSKNWDDLYRQYKNELSLEILGSLKESMEKNNE